MTSLLVDGNNLLVRAIMAAKGGKLDLSNDAGTPTAPLVIFINSMSRYLSEVKPDRAAVCWDHGRSMCRLEVFPEYKAGRAVLEPEAQEVKESAFALAKEFLALANIHQVSWPGFEADDLIASGWRFRDKDEEMVILSGDKDLLQLVRPNVRQIRPGLADESWGYQRVTEEFGCTPEQWGLVLAMAGDTSDGIPGVPRVGVKTAIKDLKAVEWDLEELLLTGHERYRTNVDLIRRNIKLVTLPMPHPLADLLTFRGIPSFRPTTPDSILWSDLLGFLDRYDMASAKTRALSGSLW